MKRWRAVSLLAFFFAAVLWLHESSAQTPIFNGFYLVDKTGNELTISDDGALRTSTNVKHISGALHIAGIAQTINVNCLSGCSGAPGAAHTAVTQAGAWTVAHVTSVTHVVGKRRMRGRIFATARPKSSTEQVGRSVNSTSRSGRGRASSSSKARSPR